MQYIKISEKEFKTVENKVEENVYNITSLKNDRSFYQENVDKYQAKIDEIDALLNEAKKLGVDEIL